MSIYQQIVAVCWAVLLVVWGVLALRPSAGRQSSRARLLTVVRLALGAAVLVGVYWLSRGQPLLASIRPTDEAGLAGAALCVAGVAFAIWARVSMSRPSGTSTRLRGEPELVTTGPFAYVRHPTYTAVTVMLIGSALANPIAYVDVLLTIVGLLVLARREERDMLRRLPDVYPAYVRRTKRFVPFLF